jgi:hypothetical protein
MDTFVGHLIISTEETKTAPATAAKTEMISRAHRSMCTRVNNEGQRGDTRSMEKSVASEPPRSAHLCKKVGPKVSGKDRERKRSKGETKDKMRLEHDVRSTMTSIVSVTANQNDARKK